MKKMLLLSLIFLWMKAKGWPPGESQFLNYQECLNEYESAPWKLMGPKYNETYYEKFNYQFNLMFEKVYPIAIFTPTTVEDVQAAVKCGVKTNIQLVPIAGGHSYAGLSMGTNDSIIIDTRYLNDISLNKEENVATVGSGAFLGRVYGTLWKNGGYGTALGSCTTVAMAGLAIGGGIGYLSPRYGLVIDNLVEINMVDASGNAVKVDETHNEDLWWAMRGVGPGYIGIVTSVKLKLFKADELGLTFIKVNFDNNSFQSVMDSYSVWLDWVNRNDPNINSLILSRSDNYTKSGNATKRPDESGTLLQILKIDDNKNGATIHLDLITAVLTIFPRPKSIVITFPSFIDFFHEISYTPIKNVTEFKNKSNDEQLEILSTLTKEDGAPVYHMAKSFYVKQKYRNGSFEDAQDLLLEIPNKFCASHVNYEGGAISQPAPNASSYVHRDAILSVKVYFETDDQEKAAECKKWLYKFYKSVKFLDSGETFQNYPDPNLSDYLNRYYGTNLKRLIEIKRKWDPNGYFDSKQSIPIQ
ncbi:Xylooligosaccharide oxidase [Pseudolycoriella hygida]|uniref:Xylooligosaccharide oxidase n=1 Tax=Pseudolycoriella hygida TaxID=35572 RepID=A0A9Q0NGS3_9DIPT|nr:Xylooligosaccharide oxidase [Pseudolycoriella hygida]